MKLRLHDDLHNNAHELQSACDTLDIQKIYFIFCNKNSFWRIHMSTNLEIMVHKQETQNIDAFENDECDVLFYIVVNCVKGNFICTCV